MGYYTDMLVNKAVLKTVSGTDENGRPNIIALEEIDCRLEMKHSLTVNAQGQQLVCSGRLYTEAVVKVDDILEIRDKVFKVVKVNPYYPLASNVCVINEVYFA